jgi:hypothetical protein
MRGYSPADHRRRGRKGRFLLTIFAVLLCADEGKVLAGRGRLAAYALLGWEPTLDDFVEYTGTDPYGVAIEDNRQWRPQSNEQKRRNVTTLLTNNPEKTDREVARQAGVSPNFVGEVRRALSSNVLGGHKPPRQEASGRRARGRRPGGSRTTHTSSRGGQSTPPPTPTPRKEEGESEGEPEPKPEPKQERRLPTGWDDSVMNRIQFIMRYSPTLTVALLLAARR